MGGTADGHIAAAENNLTEPYDVKSLDDLQPWARELYAITKKRTVGTGALVLGFGYNSELLAKKSLAPPACWDDLLKPQYKGEIQMANPNSSGTAYMVIATLVQMRGEDGAFNYLKALHGSVNSYTRSGVAPGKAAARGETGVAIGFLQDLAAEARAGFPVVTVAPCEGTGLNADGMSIVNGARNQENARAFFDWYLTPEAQAIGATVNQLHLPSNIKTPIPQGSPDPAKMSVIKFDYAKYGSSDERKRLLARWDKDIGSLPR